MLTNLTNNKIKSISCVERLFILHSCIQRGVRIRVFLEKSLDLNSITLPIQNLYIVRKEDSGFFRFLIDNKAIITGIIKAKDINIAFAFYTKAEIFNKLELFFLILKRYTRDN